MKFRSVSLSKGLEPSFGVSAVTVPIEAAPDGVVDATGAATGFALDDIPAIPMLPVKESNNPPTDGAAFTTTSGSTTSPTIMSPIACATMNAL